MTDLAPPQRNQVGALITALINTNRQARGRELLLNQVQPISFHTKQPPSAPHKPQVSSYTPVWHSHVPTLAHNKPECVLQVNLAHLAAPGGDQLQAQPLPSTSQAGLAVYTNPPAVPPAIPPKQQTAPPPHITHVVPLTRQNVDKYVAKQKGGGACIRMVRTCTLLLSYCRARRSRSRSRGSGRSHRSGRRGRRSRSKSAHSRRSKKSRRRSRSGSRHRSRKHKRRHHSSSSTSSRSYSPERHGRHKETKSRHDSRARYDQHGYVHEYPQQQQHQAYQQQGFGEC